MAEDIRNAAPTSTDNYTSPREHYWAKETGEALIRHLMVRRDDFYTFLQRSNLLNRIRRS